MIKGEATSIIILYWDFVLLQLLLLPLASILVPCALRRRCWRQQVSVRACARLSVRLAARASLCLCADWLDLCARVRRRASLVSLQDARACACASPGRTARAKGVRLRERCAANVRVSSRKKRARSNKKEASLRLGKLASSLAWPKCKRERR